MNPPIQCVAFDGTRRIASGELGEVAREARMTPNALIFSDSTSEVIELDPTGEPIEMKPRSAGRPKLGVVPREITLLPRHWDWLNLQPGGASVALRKLVDGARRGSGDADRMRLAQEAAYRFMTALAGNEEGFEEAIRGLFACDGLRFAQHIRTWPQDVREHAAKLAARVFEGNETTP